MACFTGEHVLVGVHDLWGGGSFSKEDMPYGNICLSGGNIT